MPLPQKRRGCPQTWRRSEQSDYVQLIVTDLTVSLAAQSGHFEGGVRVPEKLWKLQQGQPAPTCG